MSPFLFHQGMSEGGLLSGSCVGEHRCSGFKMAMAMLHTEDLALNLLYCKSYPSPFSVHLLNCVGSLGRGCLADQLSWLRKSLKSELVLRSGS